MIGKSLRIDAGQFESQFGQELAGREIVRSALGGDGSQPQFPSLLNNLINQSAGQALAAMFKIDAQVSNLIVPRAVLGWASRSALSWPSCSAVRAIPSSAPVAIWRAISR